MWPALFAASLLARLPMGINGLAIVLLVQARDRLVRQRRRGGRGARARQRAGRARDRPDDRPPRPALAARPGRAERRLPARRSSRSRASSAPTVPLAVAAFLAGGAFPPASSVLRTYYPQLFAGRPTLLQGAFALDSVCTETIFTAGPLITAALVVAVRPGGRDAALGRHAGRRHGRARARAAGRAAPATDAERGRRARGSARWPCRASRRSSPRCCRSASRSARSRSPCPAFADAEGQPELAGVLVALWALGSVIGGLAYGARPRRASLASVHLRFALLLPL